MRSTPILLAIATVLCGATSAAQALGFGKIANATTLGQPLNFAAGVHLDADESMARECVAADVMAGEGRVAPDQVRVTLEPGRDGQQRSVRVTTRMPIVEPIVTIDVTIGCNSRISRQFVVFVDPPLLAAPPTLAGADLPPQRLENQVAPLLAIVQSPAPARAEAPPARTTSTARAAGTASAISGTGATVARADKSQRTPASARKSAPGSTTTAAVRRAPRRVAQKTADEPRGAGPRLRLDATEPVRLGAAPLAVAADAPVAATAPAADGAAQALFAQRLAQERERIRLLETGIEQLRTDAHATRQSLAALQTQLQRAQAERYTNPLVLALAALSLLLAVVALLGWRRPQRGRWWEAVAGAEPAPAAAPVAATAATATALAPSPESSAQEDLPWTYHRPVALPTQPAEIGGLEVTTVLEPLPLRAPGDDSVTPASAAASVDELIDLQQQREFFVVLGQDAAAAQLLADHLRDRSDASPLPYLELLELLRQQGDEAAHVVLRAGFAARFGAEAPAWDAEPAHGSSLQEHPHTIAGLQSIWGHPSAVMRSLEAALLGHFAPAAGFGLAAYRELLLIYSIARDLAEHVEVEPAPQSPKAEPAIDLLLPLDGTAREAPVLHLVASTGLADAPEAATTTIDAGTATALDFDISDWTDDEPPRTAAVANSRY